MTYTINPARRFALLELARRADVGDEDAIWGLVDLADNVGIDRLEVEEAATWADLSRTILVLECREMSRRNQHQ